MPLSKYLKMAQQALQTEQGRAIGRKAADGLAVAGNRITKDKYSAQIEKGRVAINKRLGAPGGQGPGEQDQRP